VYGEIGPFEVRIGHGRFEFSIHRITGSLNNQHVWGALRHMA